MKYYLLTDKEIEEIIAKSDFDDYLLRLALEIREHRKLRGPLGCDYLEKN